MKFFKPSDRLISSAAKGLQKVVIGGLHCVASLGTGLLFDGLKGGRIGNFIAEQKAAKLAEAVVVKLPLEALFRLIAFVRSRGTMTLRLSHFYNMKQYGNMLFSGKLLGLLKGRNQLRVVPSSGNNYFVALFFGLSFFGRLALKACQCFRNTLLSRLVRCVHRNSVLIVPDKGHHRNLHDPSGVDSFPK